MTMDQNDLNQNNRISPNRYLSNHHLKSRQNSSKNTNNESKRHAQILNRSSHTLEEIVEQDEPSTQTKKQGQRKQNEKTSHQSPLNLNEKKSSPHEQQERVHSAGMSSPSNQRDSFNTIDHIDPTRLGSADFVKLSKEEQKAVLEKLESMSKLTDTSRQSERVLDEDFNDEQDTTKLKTHRQTLEEEIERKIDVLKKLEEEDSNRKNALNELNEHKRMILYFTKEIELQARKVAESTRKILEKIDEHEHATNVYKSRMNHKNLNNSATNSSSMKEISEYDSNSDLEERNDANEYKIEQRDQVNEYKIAEEKTRQRSEVFTDEYKKIIHRRFWWDKSPSNLRVPMYQLPIRKKFSDIKPKIVTGFIEEEIIVPLESLIKKSILF